ncbi:adenylyl-sulfate kinase [Mesonia maritima]|uniref:Adenylyl-sulfate kinase n=1 Tax=Mesonia maritima TaxID=1793873 RepID=A0ABU1K895_9FLAO|nr:adenylyl-sulfate kinase [Mesonia maritima]MDR6301834.1 adenylylsulfate kinase [Mesonia maritima]
MSENTIKQIYSLSRENRENKYGHSSYLVWFTGLSGSGKSTLANALEKKLFQQEKHTYVLDGDNIRQGINRDLDFSEKGRSENLRRIAEISKLFIDAGIITLAAFISPLEKDRERIKEIVGNKNIVEVYVETSLQTCEKRDVKGLYKKARKGEIHNFTGIDSPYQTPKNPDFVINTEENTIEEATQKLLTYLNKKFSTS